MRLILIIKYYSNNIQSVGGVVEALLRGLICDGVTVSPLVYIKNFGLIGYPRDTVGHPPRTSVLNTSTPAVV